MAFVSFGGFSGVTLSNAIMSTLCLSVILSMSDPYVGYNTVCRHPDTLSHDVKELEIDLES